MPGNVFVIGAGLKPFHRGLVPVGLLFEIGHGRGTGVKNDGSPVLLRKVRSREARFGQEGGRGEIMATPRPGRGGSERLPCT